MNNTAENSPKDGAQRKREHDRRKRQAGLKEFRAWVTESEAHKLRECLAKIRSNQQQEKRHRSAAALFAVG